MYIEFIPNRNSRPTVLLREAWREGGKVRKRTIANLTGLSEDKITALRLILKGEPLIHPAEAFVVEQSQSCGHVHAILKLIDKIRFKEILGPGSKLKKEIIITMVVHALFSQNAPQLAHSLLHGTTLLDDMGLRHITTREVTDTLDKLTERKKHIESQVKIGTGSVAAIAYDNGTTNTARVLIHLMADHVNINLHRMLTPLLSQDALHDDACTCLVRNKSPLSLYSYDPRETVMNRDQIHGLSILDIMDHLSAQCHIRLRITSIPGGLTVNICTPASTLQKRVFELIETYDGKGPAVKTLSWRHSHLKGTIPVPAGSMHFQEVQPVPPIQDMDRSFSETEI